MPVEVRAKKSWQNSTAGEELEEERRVREKRVAEGVSNFLAISAAGTHTLIADKGKGLHTHTNKNTYRHRTALREKGATFSFTVNIIFYCTINTKMARATLPWPKTDS